MTVVDAAYLSVISALAGSVIGGLTSFGSSWLTEQHHTKSALLSQDKLRREDLYRDFIVMASKVYADAMMHNEPQIPDLVELYALVSRMRVISSPRIVACAEGIIISATDTYFMPNKTIQEVHELVKSAAMDPLKEFSETARNELRMLTSL
jgi:hypothetical protein